ncbi:hypothetical protein GCM10010508_68450 [Streptomyces naganishii JCM 4654]|uniref:Uncharacterized protein n=1 Tax=Streptomyces naganishii JCM 4654 TaxID=1306179 RepID=A0A918YBY9_9ACTN|nr:hypothetical protein GCM10010508_68450 [Streptomyces naganishii JCM 4654]
MSVDIAVHSRRIRAWHRPDTAAAPAARGTPAHPNGAMRRRRRVRRGDRAVPVPFGLGALLSVIPSSFRTMWAKLIPVSAQQWKAADRTADVTVPTPGLFALPTQPSDLATKG